MKTLMYPIAPEDDFPEMFCAIRQSSGEHWFYAPEGESASELLLRMEIENAKLRNLTIGLYRCWQGEDCEGCPMQDEDGWCVRDIQLKKLGIEASNGQEVQTQGEVAR